MQERFDRVSRLIEGFEMPSGMELPATVHGAATRECESGRADTETVVKAEQAWSPRKKMQMERWQIQTALIRLAAAGWV